MAKKPSLSISTTPSFSPPIPWIPLKSSQTILKSPKLMGKSGNSLSDLMLTNFSQKWADTMKSLFLPPPQNVMQNKLESIWIQPILLFPIYWTDNFASTQTRGLQLKISFPSSKTCENWTETSPRLFCWIIQYTVSGTKSTTGFQLFPTTNKTVMTLSF